MIPGPADSRLFFEESTVVVEVHARYFVGYFSHRGAQARKGVDVGIVADCVREHPAGM